MFEERTEHMKTPGWDQLERELPGRLAEVRRRAEMTQEDLATAAGVTARSVKRYEAGASTMPSDVIYRMAAAGLDMRYVIFG